MDAKEHWNNVYANKGDTDVSWYQPEPALSLSLIESLAPRKDTRIIDVGGGASTLPDKLLDRGYTGLTVLDISQVALNHSKTRLGKRAYSVRWIEASVTEFAPPERYALWHDRAVFHFLTQAEHRTAYIRALGAAVPHGHAIISTFSLDGPQQCSGLDVVRYDAAKIDVAFGGRFRLIDTVRETHRTPWDTEQAFSYFVLTRK